MVSKPKLPPPTPAGPACNTAKFGWVCFVLLFYFLCVSRGCVHLNHTSIPGVVQLHPSDTLSESPRINPSCWLWTLMSVPNSALVSTPGGWNAAHCSRGETAAWRQQAAFVRLSIWHTHVSNGLPGQQLLTLITVQEQIHPWLSEVTWDPSSSLFPTSQISRAHITVYIVSCSTEGLGNSKWVRPWYFFTRSHLLWFSFLVFFFSVTSIRSCRCKREDYWKSGERKYLSTYSHKLPMIMF